MPEALVKTIHSEKQTGCVDENNNSVNFHQLIYHIFKHLLSYNILGRGNY